MEIIRREVQRVEEVITYKAKDGRVFTSEAECVRWENSYECTINECMNKIPHKVVDGEECWLPNSNYDDNVWIMKPRNLEDIKVINAYLNNIDSCNGNRLTQDDIGKTICINFGYDYDWYVFYRYPDFITNIKNAFDKIESEIEEKYGKES